MFSLIKDTSITVFVPCEIEQKYFSGGELDFLQAYESDIAADGMIDGEKVWNIYTNIISKRNAEFKIKADIKILSLIVAKFTFSVWAERNAENLLKHRTDTGDYEHGIIKLSKESYSKIYSYETGLAVDLETDVNFI